MIQQRICNDKVDFIGILNKELNEKEIKYLGLWAELLERREPELWPNLINELKEELGIVNIIKFGRYHCSPGYTNYLNPELSYKGSDPETVKKIEKYEEYLKSLKEELGE